MLENQQLENMALGSICDILGFFYLVYLVLLQFIKQWKEQSQVLARKLLK